MPSALVMSDCLLKAANVSAPSVAAAKPTTVSDAGNRREPHVLIDLITSFALRPFRDLLPECPLSTHCRRSARHVRIGQGLASAEPSALAPFTLR